MSAIHLKGYTPIDSSKYEPPSPKASILRGGQVGAAYSSFTDTHPSKSASLSIEGEEEQIKKGIGEVLKKMKMTEFLKWVQDLEKRERSDTVDVIYVQTIRHLLEMEKKQEAFELCKKVQNVFYQIQASSFLVGRCGAAT